MFSAAWAWHPARKKWSAMHAARAALLSALFLLLPLSGCDDDGGGREVLTCDEHRDCASLTDEGGACCEGICVDCWADSDGDGTFDCDDPDTGVECVVAD